MHKLCLSEIGRRKCRMGSGIFFDMLEVVVGKLMLILIFFIEAMLAGRVRVYVTDDLWLGPCRQACS